MPVSQKITLITDPAGPPGLIVEPQAGQVQRGYLAPGQL
jgi:hypothetical protein